jgi:phage baseplate assembly protein W
MASTIIYSDLDLRFLPNPVTGDVSMSYNEQAVIRSIQNLLYTKPYERLFDPTIGSGIPALLFEPLSPLTASSIEDEITRLISNYEPRATIYQLNVSANADSNSFTVSLYVFIGNNTAPTAINLILQRNR